MKCRVCKSNKLTSILSLGNQYLSEFRDDDIKPPKHPLNLVICNNCNQVQLDSTVPQDLLYTDNYGYRSGINATMRNHLQDIALKLMEMTIFKPGDVIVDIGSNDGTLLKSFSPLYRRVGYDLVPKFGKDYISTSIEFYDEPFTSRSFLGKARIITAISMFYDLDNPMALMKDMAESLDSKGVILIQQNYLLSMLQNNAFDNLCHEHLCYHSLLSMKKIVESFGLQIFDIETNDLNGGSFRIFVCHEGNYHISPRVKKQLAIELDYELDHVGAYNNFAERVKDVTQNLYGLLADIHRCDESCFIYGASTRGNTLLQYCGIDNRLVQKAVERNPEKFGKKIASVGIPIISEEQARKEHPAYMLVLPWQFRKEIVDREYEYLKGGGNLILPLPRVEIVHR